MATTNPDFQSFGLYAAPRLSTAWHVRRPPQGRALGLTKLRANFGLGIKEPTLLESFSQSPYFKGNPDLAPEKAVCYDAGVDQQFADNRAAAAVTWFENRFRDQIGYEVTDYQTFEGSFFNLGRTRARGLETLVRGSMGHAWMLSGGYTYLDSEVLESASPWDPVFAEGRPLLRRPRHSGTAEIQWEPRRWTFGAGALMVGRRADSDFAGLGITRAVRERVRADLPPDLVRGDPAEFARLGELRALVRRTA